MADKDIITKEYMSNNVIFADVFNFYFYGGRQVINPDSLKELDTNEKVVINGIEQNLVSQKFRDLLKSCIIKTDGEYSYVLLGIENQTKVDYSMVIRVMLYDAMQYLNQYNDNGKKKNKKLVPVITLVVYWDSKPWNAPKSLHEMLEPDYKHLVNDFKIHVLDPSSIDDKDMLNLVSEYYNACWFIKHQKDSSDNITNALVNNTRFESVSSNTAFVINTMTGTDFNTNGVEEINMCDAWNELENRGIKKGIEKGKLDKTLDIINNMLSNGFDWDTIESVTNMTKSEYEHIKSIQ